MDIDILINRNHSLDKNYVPNDLVKVKILETPKLNNKMLTYLKKEVYMHFLEFRLEGLYNNVNMIVDSGYRSYNYQKQILAYNILKNGQKSLNLVALPGYSEHQSGLSLDFALIKNNFYISEFDDSFNEVKWIHKNAYKYGFILRYPKNKEQITGFSYECWHLRYVGKNVSYFMHDNNILTLEEYHLIKNKKILQKTLVKHK